MAWLGKGKAAGWQSSLQNIRITEALLAFSHAIANTDDVSRATLTSDVIEEANKLIVALYGMARRHLEEFVALDQSWVEYLNRVSQLLNGLEQVRSWAPHDRITLENIVHLCKDNIEGISYRNFDNTPNAWHLSPEYETLIRSRLDFAVNELRALDPSYAPPAIEKKQAESCFVVTATMGDPNHPTVTSMRAFRDEWLALTPTGRELVQKYYLYGPSVAAFVSKSRIRRTLSYWIIVVPAAAIAKFLMLRRAP